MKKLTELQELRLERKKLADETRLFNEKLKERRVVLNDKKYKLQDKQDQLIKIENDKIWDKIQTVKPSKIKIDFMGSKKFNQPISSYCIPNDKTREGVQIYNNLCKEMARIQKGFDIYYKSKAHKKFIKWCFDEEHNRHIMSFKHELIMSNRNINK